ncbi:hypothetical protein [Flavobacterium granuli]|uniref:Uncharacterized protein n=1 Tax=Flavobacterium granuli TaxID=280093 RepID=A0A1M5U6X8_9FLAO|nr:hypothetical protein [Flavobacterium granuli]PRZ19579.1 hypothetical protein BC624_11627 [Flavobacterium granuli]SHH58815.1 hypothetical protein SAMN05443373_11827 [Flavobacterium granuli]
MENNEYIKIGLEQIEKYSSEFLEKSKPNQFYDKSIFFTQNLNGSKHNHFQIIGNLGGYPTESEFLSETNFYIISEKIINDLKNGNLDNQIIELEKKLNAKGKKHSKLKILTEKVFLKHIEERSLNIGDMVTLELVNKIL